MRTSASSTAGNRDVDASHLLIATGRRPNTDDLGLSEAGVALDDKGYIIVDDHLSTNVAGIWALGDCNGRGAFTHTSYNDFEIVAANLLDGEDRKVSERIPAYALYIDPPLGRVGMTEREARATGRAISVSTMPMSRVGRAIEKDETKGLMKVVADVETGQILGAAILGVDGDEAIHGFIDAMHARTPLPGSETGPCRFIHRIRAHSDASRWAQIGLAASGGVFPSGTYRHLLHSHESNKSAARSGGPVQAGGFLAGGTEALEVVHETLDLIAKSACFRGGAFDHAGILLGDRIHAADRSD